MKKILSLALSLFLILSLMPAVFAAKGATISCETVSHGSISVRYHDDQIPIDEITPIGANTQIDLVISANEGYALKSLTVNDVNVTDRVSGDIYTFQMLSDNVTVAAIFDKTYSITMAEENDMVTLSKLTAFAGEEIIITVSSAQGYALDALCINGTNYASQMSNSKYTFTMASENVTVEAIFKLKGYSISVGATTNGVIEAAASAAVGATGKVKVTPSAGYKLKDLYYIEEGKSTKVEISKDADGDYAFIMPANNITLYSSFTDEFTVNLVNKHSAYGELYFPDEAVSSVNYKKAGKEVIFVAKPRSDSYKLGSLTVSDSDGKEHSFQILNESDCSYYFTMQAVDVTITATFIKESTNAISVKSAPNGAVTAAASAESGDSVTLTINADEGYVIGDLIVSSGGKVIPLTKTASSQYTFVMPSSSVEITSSFISAADAHSVTVEESAYGVLVSSAINAVDGKIVALTPVEDSFYELKEVYVHSDTYTITTEKKTDGSYTFKMPDANITVVPSFGQKRIMGFADVKSTDWYYEEVKYVYEHNIMNGMDETTFEPNTSITRGMIVTMLYRLEGEPTYTQRSTFPDVLSGVYYSDAVYWAQSVGVVIGYDTGFFGPGDAISREQLSAILFRYAGLKNYDISDNLKITGFDDYSDVSAYAQVAMQWAYSHGIVTGKTTTTIVPRENATRAEVAVSFARLCKNIAGM